MHIELNETHRIASIDSRNWATQKLCKSKNTDKAYWTNLCYFGSLRNALHSALDDPRFLMDKKTKKECFAWFNKIELILKNNP